MRPFFTGFDPLTPGLFETFHSPSLSLDSESLVGGEGILCCFLRLRSYARNCICLAMVADVMIGRLM